MIEAVGLSKRFGSVSAIQDVDLNVQEGDIAGLVGPDGAGKTTLMRILCGLIDPDAGQARVNNCPVSQIENIKGQIGYMPQRFSLYMDLTVMENIRFFASLYGIPWNTIQSRAGEILPRMGIEGFRRRLAGNLSGGMKQKLALTCSLISRPRLLILDEPTYGVDPESRQEFWRILYELNHEGLTILVSTPYMDEAELCTQVAVINEGRIMAMGRPAELKSLLRYALLEVKAHSKAPDLFKDCAGIAGATFYGDKYHLTVDDPAAASRVVNDYLQEKGIEVHSLRVVAPSMEDVYVELVSRQGERS